MLPVTVPASHRDAAHPDAVRRVADTASLRDLDELMFKPSGWFAIGADNQYVKGVRISSLEAGLSLVGEGQVATVVGRLRPHLRVVDIDLAGERGHAAAEQLASWCRREDLWCLVRPSGGADGRSHLFIAPGDRVEGLAAFVDQLRSSMRASTQAIDLRPSLQVRPLSAPHRHGAHPRPYGDLRAALRALRAQQAGTTPNTAPSQPRKARGSTGGSVALTPRPRRRVDLPEPWANYLRTGVAPPHYGSDHSRTTDELRATAALVRAGHTAETAWTLVTAAHPNAMVRARAKKRRWIAWVWNRAVEDDHAHTPVTGTDPAVEAAIAGARARLADLMWTIPVRRRRALLLVGHHVLDRMARANTRRVPVPERDLVEDTGLTDRKTIRNALRLINGLVGELHTEAWDPSLRDSSSYEFEIPCAQEQGLWQIPPPSPHTPLPRGTWTQLPGYAHALWRTLVTHTGPLSPADLAQCSGITERPEERPTPSQLRSTTQGLTELSRAGLADCTADGTWIARNAPATEHIERAAARHKEIAETVAGERAAYRAPAATWNLARARALKAQLSKERAWWNGLDASERVERRIEWASRFDRMSVVDQEHVKAQLARRRVGAGVDEAERHGAWANALAAHDYLERSIRRHQQYASLAPPLQVAAAQSWQRHRDRFGIGRGPTGSTTRHEHAELLPSGPRVRDAAFLDEQLRVIACAIEESA